VTCLALQAFDTEIFGIPCYRVVALDETGLARDLPPVLKQRPVMVDAKVPAARNEMTRRLQELGFRIVCTQIVFHREPDPISYTASEVSIVPRLEIDDATVDAHAANFIADRHALDPLVGRARHDALYDRWIRNSLSGRMLVASHGRNFCTFRTHDDHCAIDLLSVLDKRRGIGRALLNAVLDYSIQQLKPARVITECGNEAAWRLYLSCGFHIVGFINCLHFVAT